MPYESYLSHHGIKGQKWGVENGPPYPLNDVVKAIAYRGGEMKDGRRVVNLTGKDVKKARKIINKNLKAMSEEEIREYKSRILLERDMGEVLGNDAGDKLARKLKNNAVDMVSDSLKTTGTKALTNVEMAAIGEAVSAVFGADVAAMVTNGLSKYDLAEKKYQKSRDKYQQNKEEREYKDRQEERKYQREQDRKREAQQKVDNEDSRIKSIAALYKSYNSDKKSDVDDILKDILDDDDLEKAKKLVK